MARGQQDEKPPITVGVHSAVVTEEFAIGHPDPATYAEGQKTHWDVGDEVFIVRDTTRHSRVLSTWRVVEPGGKVLARGISGSYFRFV